MTDKDVPPSVGISIPGYKPVDGYRHINIFVRFNQEKPDEAPVDLGVLFAFDTKGTMSARRYVNLEENVPGPQNTNFIEVSGSGSWHTTSAATSHAFRSWGPSSGLSSTIGRPSSAWSASGAISSPEPAMALTRMRGAG
jgi:hypothetical protein